MSEVLTAAEMRACEAAAISSGAATGLQLMERAGEAVVAAILAVWPELEGQGGGAAPVPPRYLRQDERGRAVVLCGPGNNGGDGFVVARLLRARGWEVEVRLYGDPGGLPPDAAVNHRLWCELGAVLPLSAGTWEERNFPGRCDLVIDALFGIGLSRPVELPLLALPPGVEVGQTHRVVSIDVPSGLCADSGRVIGREVVMADLTVTFHRTKCGHVLGEGLEDCGRLVVADIGLDLPPSSGARLASAPLWALKRGGHKYDHGHALVLSGPAAATGAARLAARGALRAGAGLVTLGAPGGALAECAAQLTAVMLREVADGAALAEILDDRRINALCLGPGLGTGPRAAGLVAAALRARRAAVFDADALTILARDPALFAALHRDCVLTPHAGEFARLFPDIAERLAAPAMRGPAWSKVDAVREAARRAGAVVLLKGPDTVIAAPDGEVVISAAAYDRAAPWLATAGAGDVLAGFIAGLLARGAGPLAAAEAGAWLHVECARQFGPGLIAEDLPETLPAVFRALEG